MKITRKWMIVRADGSCRVVTKRPYELRMDEVAIPINISAPDSWGRVYDRGIDITMPAPPVIEEAIEL